MSAHLLHAETSDCPAEYELSCDECGTRQGDIRECDDCGKDLCERCGGGAWIDGEQHVVSLNLTRSVIAASTCRRCALDSLAAEFPWATELIRDLEIIAAKYAELVRAR